MNWDETGYFDLSQDAVPKISSQVVAQSVFEVSETKPILNRVVRDGTVKYVIKFKGKKTESANTVMDDVKNNLSRDRSYALFSKWIESKQKSSLVEKNQQAVSGR